MFSEDDLFPISALQHLAFCERQCALIHIEQAWSENRLTAEGRLMHERVHGQEAETRGDVQEGIDTAYLAAGEGRRMYGDTAPSELPNKFCVSFRMPVGVAGIITLAKARGKIALLPLLGLSLALAIAVSGGLLVSTVRSGQAQASWERVGGDVRVDGLLDDSQVATLEAQGLTVSRIVAKPYVAAGIGHSSPTVYFMAVDDNYVSVIEDAGLVAPDGTTGIGT